MTFGTDLKYHIPAIVQYVGDGIGLLHEFRDFIKERAQIEKEYADKLEKLTKRYAVKKDKKKGAEKQDRTGDDDDEWNLEDTESTTFKAWATLLSETEAIARSRALFSDKLTTQVSDNLKVIATKKEEARKKHIAFYQKLKTERDKSYNDKDSAKKTYDDSCEELETLRIKIDKTGDYPDKLKKQEEQILIDRNNNKNIYLLAVGVANAHKQKFYDEDIPALADVRTNSVHASLESPYLRSSIYLPSSGSTQHIQDLNTSRILVLRDVMNTYVELDSSCLRETQTHLKILSGTVQAMDPDTDANIFIRQCVVSAAAIDIATKGETLARSQFVFKPWNGGDKASATVVDRDVNLVNEDSAAVYLNNILVKDRKKLAEISADLDKRGREADSLTVQKQKLEGTNDSQGVHDVTENLMESLRHITIIRSSLVRYDTEIAMITESIGAAGLEARGHEFKQISFAIPTTCDYCQTNIWGAKQGFTCKECGYNCHAKCEMKVPPDCTRVKGKITRKPSMAVQPQSTSAVPPPPSVSPVGTIRSNRSNTSASSSSASLQPPIYNAATKPRSPTSPAPKPAKVKQVTATALYAYDAETDEELPLKEGDVLTVIQKDDGSGWVKARMNFREGLVPANYIQIHTPSASTSPVSPRSQESSYFDETPTQEYVRVLYDFKGQSPEELSLRTGDVIALTSKGEDGWWEGTLNGRSGIFPENYVEKM